MSASFIEVSNVSKSFGTATSQVEALTDVSFDIREGEFFTIIGPSGCGKSTMLAIIAGLQTPSSGSVKVE